MQLEWLVNTFCMLHEGERELCEQVRFFYGVFVISMLVNAADGCCGLFTRLDVDL